jgi:phage tail protein X
MNRYQGIPIIKSLEGKQMYATSRYPEVPLSENDIYVYSTWGDRFDILAYKYYSDSSLWWVIAIANPDVFDLNNIIIPPGIQIRIPNTYSNIIDNFVAINQI